MFVRAIIAITSTLVAFNGGVAKSQTDAGNQARGCSYHGYSNSNFLKSRILSSGHPDFRYERMFESVSSKMLDHIELNDDPNIFFIDDSNSPNAHAFSAGGISPKPTVLMGVRLMDLIDNHQYSHPEAGAGASIAVLAHELAHISQYDEAVSGSVRDIELMADGLSGWLMAYLFSNALEEAIQVGEEEEFWESVSYPLRAAVRNTYDSGSYDYTNPNFHGTPDQRSWAFNTGYDLFWKHYTPGIGLGDVNYWSAFYAFADYYGISK